MKPENHEKELKEFGKIDRDIKIANREWAEWKDHEVGPHGINIKLSKMLENRDEDNENNRSWNRAIFWVAVATLVITLISSAFTHWPKKNDNQQGRNNETEMNGVP